MRALSAASIAGWAVLVLIPSTFAAPRVEVQNGAVLIAGGGYRARFVPESAGFDLEVQDARGRWQPVAAGIAGTTLGIFADRELPAGSRRATWALRHDADAVVVGQQVVLDARRGLTLELHCCCTDRGLLLGSRLIGPAGSVRSGWLWSPLCRYGLARHAANSRSRPTERSPATSS